MPQYYLDIETTGINPNEDEIVTIQLQELNKDTGEPIGELIILKRWESSEKEIIQKFLSLSNILDSYPFSFVPVGYNLNFDHNFLKKRAEINNLPQIDILNCPFIDLRAIGVLMNKGQFKGSKLDHITGKKEDGGRIPEWYKNRNYNAIINYVKDETREFLKFYGWLYKTMLSSK